MIADNKQPRILIVVLAENAEQTLPDVLSRIPPALRSPALEVLVINDFSNDRTFAIAMECEKSAADLKVTVLRPPGCQGYGGNQKLGCRYALDQGFDFVALFRGDGSCAPEQLPSLLEPLLQNKADAVLGSGMLDKKQALHNGMPFYKWIANQFLSGFLNAFLGTSLTGFHSGCRLYSTNALRQIPFERNSDGLRFDTEIIIQLVMKGLRITELPVPICKEKVLQYVNGLRYAWDIVRTVLRAKLHTRNLLYDRKFDTGPVEETYDLKLGFASSHTMAIAAAVPGANILDIGCGRGYVAEQLARTAKHVTGIDQFAPIKSPLTNLNFLTWNLDSIHLPVDISHFDQIFMLDIIEHLKDPEIFMENLRHATALRRPEIILTTANISFFVTRAMLFFGHFNYGRKGILDRTHTRLFTFNSMIEVLQQSGFEILDIQGIPAPFPRALGDNRFSRGLVSFNAALIRLNKGMFAYQIFIRARAKPTVSHLLQETLESSAALKNEPVAVTHNTTII